MFSEQLENWDCHHDDDLKKKSSSLKKKSIQISNLFSLKRNRHSNINSTNDCDKHKSQSTIDTTDTENSFDNSSNSNDYYYHHDNNVSDSDQPPDDVVVETTTATVENTIGATNEDVKAGRRGVGTTLIYAAGMVVRVAGYAAGAALNVSNVGEAVSAVVDVCEAVVTDPNNSTSTTNNDSYPAVDKEFYANSLTNFRQIVQAHEQRMKELNINNPTSSLSASLSNERTVPLTDAERKEQLRKNFEAALKSYQEMNMAMQRNPKF